MNSTAGLLLSGSFTMFFGGMLIGLGWERLQPSLYIIGWIITAIGILTMAGGLP